MVLQWRVEIVQSADVSPILPPRDRDTSTTHLTLRVPKWLREELERVAEESGYRLTEVAVRFLEFGLEEHKREQNQKLAPKKK